MIKTFTTTYTLLFFVVLVALVSFTGYPPDCNSIKTGTFHFYQNKGQYHAVVSRKGTWQIEVNTKTGDTTNWRVAWLSDCAFTTTYISGNRRLPPDQLDFFNKATLKYKITGITKDYYTFDAIITYQDKTETSADTMWLAEKR